MNLTELIGVFLGVVGLGTALVMLSGRYYIRFLTRRYLFRRLISYLAMFGIMSSVWILVVVPSVMNGFGEEYRAKVRGTLSDLMVWGGTPFSLPAPMSYDTIPNEKERIRVQRQILSEIYSNMKSVPGVQEISPYIENPALFKNVSQIDYAFVRGFDPALEAKTTKFRDYIMSPRETLKMLNEDYLRRADPEEARIVLKDIESKPDKVDYETVYRQMSEGYRNRRDGKVRPGVLVGIFFLRAYKLVPGATIKLTTASDKNEAREDLEFTIVGAFKTGFYEADRRKIYMGLNAAQRFIGIEERVSGISIKCKPDATAEEVRNRIKLYVRQQINEGKFPDDALARTWEEKDYNLLQAVRMEKLLIRLICFAILVGAIITIFITLYMSVREKTQDLGILKALGGTTSGVLRIYMGQGALIAILGAALGIALGYYAASYLNEIADIIHSVSGWHPFPPDIYYLDSIPVKIIPSEILEIVGFTLLASIFLAFWPGLWASKLDPIQAIRNQA